MRLTVLLSIAASLLRARAQSAVDDAELSAILADLQANEADYLGQIVAGNSPPAGLLSLVQQVLTYTDDSYTTLYSEVDIDEVNSYITGLPWYSSRLSSEIAAATEAVAVSSSSSESSSVAPSSSSAVPSSSAPESSSTAPSSSSSAAAPTSSSVAASSSTPSSSSAPESSAPESSAPQSSTPSSSAPSTGSSSCQDEIDDAELSAILTDLKANEADYLGQISAGNSPPAGLLSLVEEVLTYTDDSYTTLYSNVDIDQVNSYITGLPWYSTRLSSEIAAATGTITCGSSSAAESSVTSSSSAPESSSAASSSAPESSSAPTSSLESSVAPSSSAPESSTPVSSSPASSSPASSAPASSAPASSSPAESCTVVPDADAAKDAELSAILADLQANQADYLGQISDGNTPPAALLSLVEEALTYTDDSYTTLYSNVDLDQVNSYITGLPWYSSRLEPAISSATATVAGVTSCASGSSSVPDSSSVPQSSAAPSSSASESSVAPSSSAPVSSAPASSSVPQSSAAPSESCTVVPDADAAKDAELSAILADLQANQADYLGQIADGNTPPAALLSLVEEALTYTDDSYTTLYSNVDLDQVNSYITGLPWYSSRLEPAISSATATVGGVTSCVGGSSSGSPSSSGVASSSSATSTPYFSGYLQDGQPHWDIHIPGALGPWTEVAITGSKDDGAAYSFVSAQFTVDGGSSVDGTTSDSDYSGTYSDAIDVDSELLLSINALASGPSPYGITAAVSITTSEGARIRFLVKRATVTFDLSNTITEDATISSSSESTSPSSSESAVVSCTVVPDADAAKAAELSAILSDLQANQADYLGQIADGNTPPAALLSLVQDALTYTDDSYTTLYSDVDLDQVNSYITGLPWYSSRLEPAISSATATVDGVTSCVTEGGSTTTDNEQSTTLVTITSCSDNACSSSTAVTGVTVVTETVSGTVTEYTTYCPLTATESSAEVQCTVIPGTEGGDPTVAELSAILADLKANQADYLGQIADGNTPPSGLLSLVQQALTYTDDSYTTLYSEVDIDQVNSYITGLPWYSSRLEPAISSATADLGGSDPVTSCSTVGGSGEATTSAPGGATTAAPSTGTTEGETTTAAPASEASEVCTVISSGSGDAKSAELSAILADLQANQADYLGQIADGNTPPSGLLSLVQDALTYTDDSYTTLYGEVDLDEVNSYITGLPWYSSRLEPAISSATANAGASSVTSCSAVGGSGSEETTTASSGSGSSGSASAAAAEGSEECSVVSSGSGDAKSAELSAILADLQANQADYLGQIADGNTPPSGLLSLVQDALTYTDDSYTTLYGEVDLDEVNSYITGLPWYSSRLEPAISSATANAGGSSVTSCSIVGGSSETSTPSSASGSGSSGSGSSGSASAAAAEGSEECSVVSSGSGDAKSAELSAILADLQANQADYLGQIADGNTPPAALLSLVQDALTYTDDSYTTLYGEVDLDEVNSYITGLPWYSSRLEPAISSATANAGGSSVTSCSIVSGSGSSGSNSGAGAAAEATTLATTSASSGSSSGSGSTTGAVSTYEGAGAMVATSWFVGMLSTLFVLLI